MSLQSKPAWLCALGGALALTLVVLFDLGGRPPVATARPAAAAASNGNPSRNLVNLVDKDVRLDFVLRPKDKQKNVKWTATMGSKSYAGPVIAGGRVYVGTNNKNPRDPNVKGDKGVLMCFREKDGQFLWQITHDKLPSDANDWPGEGIASTPWVDGDRVYYVNNRAELVCADAAGDEKAGKGKVLWLYDMVKELGVFPCQLANSSPLVVGELVYALTGNGVDAGTGKLPSPKAPSLAAVNKKTGKLAWSSGQPGPNVIRGQWSSPAAATVGGVTQVVYGGGDGWMYGLEAKSGKLLWKFDCNPKGVKPYKPGGSGERSFIVATPVLHDNRCYVAVGQEPDDGNGVGHLWCIDLAKALARGKLNKDHDVSPVKDNFNPQAAVNKDSALAWHHGGAILPRPQDGREYVFGRTLSTVAVHDGLVYASEIGGFLQCLDAKTGQKQWEHDFTDSTWCSPYYVDGKVFIGVETGDLYVFKAGRKKAELAKIEVGQAIKVPVVVCHGVLYINAGPTLFAVRATK
jgi:outer membrane protein assembly factor BamB